MNIFLEFSGDGREGGRTWNTRQ